MRTIFSLIVTIVFTVLLLKHSAKQQSPERKHCVGYTKIEYGKAVDCKGDTIHIDEQKFKLKIK
jgi:hypothetical protein